MDRIKRYAKHGINVTLYVAQDHEKTRQGQAYTPAQMAKLTERGLPVNNINNQKCYYDGDQNATFHVGQERTKGVDVAELWEAQQVLRAKARKAALSKKK